MKQEKRRLSKEAYELRYARITTLKILERITGIPGEDNAKIKVSTLRRICKYALTK